MEFLTIADKRETLRSFCSALAKEYKLDIELDAGVEHVAHIDKRTNKIVIGTRDLWKNNTDHYLGKVLHEIAHFRFSPAYAGIPKKTVDLLNLLEDIRVNEKIAQAYSGGAWYLYELQEPVLLELERNFYSMKQPTGRHVYKILTESFTEDEMALVEVAKTPAEAEAARERVVVTRKKKLLYQILTICVLEFEERLPVSFSLDNEEVRSMVQKLVPIMRQAKFAPSEDIPTLTARMAKILDELLVEEKEESCGQSLVRALAQDGHRTSKEKSKSDRLHLYGKQDRRAKPLVERLKKRIISQLRENDHQRYIGGKRKGLLDKKSLSRTARNNFRIYRKREERKGKDYAVSVILDASGSMFQHGGRRMELATQSAALLVRTFRALRFPTSLVIYGQLAKTVLDFRERYLPETIEDKMESSSCDFWWSGENETNLGIVESLRRLVPVAGDKHKIIIIITDGGLDSDDVKESAWLLAKAKNCTPFIFYVESHTQRILHSEENEREIHDVDELPSACVELIKQLTHV